MRGEPGERPQEEPEARLGSREAAGPESKAEPGDLAESKGAIQPWAEPAAKARSVAQAAKRLPAARTALVDSPPQAATAQLEVTVLGGRVEKPARAARAEPEPLTAGGTAATELLSSPPTRRSAPAETARDVRATGLRA